MKKYILFLVLILFGFKGSLYSQDDQQITLLPEKKPSFIGSFQSFVAQNLKYPQEDLEYEIEGKTELTFIIDRDSTIKNITVTKSSGSKRLDMEAMRILGLTNKMWKPGSVSDKLVKTYAKTTIIFSLGRGPVNKPSSTFPMYVRGLEKYGYRSGNTLLAGCDSCKSDTLMIHLLIGTDSMAYGVSLDTKEYGSVACRHEINAILEDLEKTRWIPRTDSESIYTLMLVLKRKE